jgi:hypothetical protein
MALVARCSASIAAAARASAPTRTCGPPADHHSVSFAGGYCVSFTDRFRLSVSFTGGYCVSFTDRFRLFVANGFPYSFACSHSYSAFDDWHPYPSTQHNYLSGKRQQHCRDCELDRACMFGVQPGVLTG